MFAFTVIGLSFLAFSGWFAFLLNRRGLSRNAAGICLLLVIWSTVFLMYLWNPLGLARISNSAALLLISNIFLLVCGLFVGGITRPQPTGSRFKAACFSDMAVMKVLFVLFFTIGTCLLLIYILRISSLYGFNSGTLALIRFDGLPAGKMGVGFYYFYFLTPAAALAFMLALKGKSPNLMAPLAGFCGFALVLTSGRMNVMLAVLWCTFIAFVSIKQIRYKAMSAVLSALILVFAFTVMGNSVGKNFENSYLANQIGTVTQESKTPPITTVSELSDSQIGTVTQESKTPPITTVSELSDSGLDMAPCPVYGDVRLLKTAPGPAASTVILGYILPQVSYFGALVDCSPEKSVNPLTLRPILQIWEAIGGAASPSNIQRFIAVPTPTNLGTFAAIGQSDFGSLGGMGVSFILGLLIGYLLSISVSMGHLGVVLAGFLYAMLLLTVIDAGWANLYFWFWPTTLLLTFAVTQRLNRNSQAISTTKNTLEEI
jgi:hypothetical protein